MMGLVVVARLAARHGVKVELRPADASAAPSPTSTCPPACWCPGRSPAGPATGARAARRASPAAEPARPRRPFAAPLALESGSRRLRRRPAVRPEPADADGGTLGTAAGRSVPAWSDLTGAPGRRRRTASRRRTVPTARHRRRCRSAASGGRTARRQRRGRRARPLPRQRPTTAAYGAAITRQPPVTRDQRRPPSVPPGRRRRRCRPVSAPRHAVDAGRRPTPRRRLPSAPAPASGRAGRPGQPHAGPPVPASRGAALAGRPVSRTRASRYRPTPPPASRSAGRVAPPARPPARAAPAPPAPQAWPPVPAGDAATGRPPPACPTRLAAVAGLPPCAAASRERRRAPAAARQPPARSADRGSRPRLRLGRRPAGAGSSHGRGHRRTVRRRDDGAADLPGAGVGLVHHRRRARAADASASDADRDASATTPAVSDRRQPGRAGVPQQAGSPDVAADSGSTTGHRRRGLPDRRHRQRRRNGRGRPLPTKAGRRLGARGRDDRRDAPRRPVCPSASPMAQLVPGGVDRGRDTRSSAAPRRRCAVCCPRTTGVCSAAARQGQLDQPGGDSGRAAVSAGWQGA